MKYYDIEIFKESKLKIKIPSSKYEVPLFMLIAEIHCDNDCYFLKNLHHRAQNYYDLNNEWFTKVLMSFYYHYDGDPIEWLEHTMNIIYPFNDIIADDWIQWERRNVKNTKRDVYKYLIQYKDDINNRKGTKKEVMLKIAQQKNCPYEYSYLDRIRKEMNLIFR